MNYEEKSPQFAARCALTSLQLARIQEKCLTDFDSLSWEPLNWQQLVKVTKKLTAHVSKLFPVYEMWDEDFEFAENFAYSIPVLMYGVTFDEISDMGSDGLGWYHLEALLVFAEGWWGDGSEAIDELDLCYNIPNPAPVWKIFMKLELMLENDELQQNKERWANMARRLRYLTSNTDYQFLDRTNEEQGHSGQQIPWEREWVEALTEQWQEAEAYFDATWSFVNWVKEGEANFDEALKIIRRVCTAVAEDEAAVKKAEENKSDDEAANPVQQAADAGINSQSDYMQFLEIQQLLAETEGNENDIEYA